MNYRNVSTRGLDNAASDAGVNRTEWQSSRSTTSVTRTGSHLTQSGLDPVGVQRQMGHARPSITMDLYVHEFEISKRREQVGEHLAAALGGLVCR